MSKQLFEPGDKFRLGGFLQLEAYDESYLVGHLNPFFVHRLCSPLGRIEKCVKRPNPAGIRDDHVEACDGRFFPREAEAPRQPPYPVMGVWSTQLAENEIRKLEQEALDRIVDRFGPNLPTVRIDEYAVRFPYRRYGHAPLLRVAL